MLVVALERMTIAIASPSMIVAIVVAAVALVNAPDCAVIMTFYAAARRMTIKPNGHHP